MSSAAVFAGAVLAFLGTVIVGMLTYTQSRKSARDAPYGDMVAELKDTRQELKDTRTRMDGMQKQIDDLRGDVRQAKDEAHESRNAAEQAVAENVAWADHHLSVVEVVAAVRRPWPEVPKALRHRLADTDYPSVPLVEGPAPIPDPADDGQTDPTTIT